MGYKKTVVKGVGWMSTFRVFSRLFSILRIAIIARILSPSDFGVFGVATLALTFLETLTQAGISTYLIQEKDNLKSNINTAYFISVVRGLIIGFLLLVSSRPIAYFFGSLQSTGLIQLLGLVAIIRGFMNPTRVVYLKELKFKSEFYLNMSTFLLDTLVSVILVFITKSPIALVWGLLFASVLETVYSWVKLTPRPKFTFNKVQLKSMLSRGKWFTSQSVSNYLFEQGDDMVVGKLLKTSSLGIYQTAYKISTLPITEISRVFNLVTFPIYTNMSEEKQRLKRAYISIMKITGILVFLVGVILFTFSDKIILILLGDKWIDAIPVLKVLTIFGVVRSFVISANPLFNAIKKQDYTAKITIFGLIIMVLTIGPLISEFGVLGACYSVTLASMLSLPLTLRYVKRVFNE